jgi:hypothetical protein
MLDQVQARIEALSERLRTPRNPKKSNRRKPKPNYRNCAKAREAQQRQRRDRLFQERITWEVSVYEFQGNMTEIARYMGVDWNAARSALWDLGLWPLVVRMRGEK